MVEREDLARSTDGISVGGETVGRTNLAGAPEETLTTGEGSLLLAALVTLTLVVLLYTLDAASSHSFDLALVLNCKKKVKFELKPT